MNLIRNLIGLIIITTMLPICALTFKYAGDINFDYNEINDEIALMQLRELMLISYDVYINNDSVDFIYKNKQFKLSNVNDKLILQPGTQIFLNDIDDLYFDERNSCIYVCYKRKNKNYERIIGSAEGIYIDDFSNCYVLDFDTDSSQE